MATKTTTAKKTAPVDTKADATVDAAEPTVAAKLRDRAIAMQQRSLEMQETAFDRTYDAVVSVQERSEDRVNSWLDNSERLPTEAKTIVQEWIGFNQTARKSYRNAVSTSFDLSQKWFEGLKQSA